MGKVGLPYGVHGWLRIAAYSVDPTSLTRFKTWYLGSVDDLRKVSVIRYKVNGKGLLVALDGLTSRDDALRYRGLTVFIPRKNFPKTAENEFYLTDLIGLRVLTADSSQVGLVTGILETGANHVLVINDDRNKLVPFIDSAIKSLDLEGGTLILDWDFEY